MSPQVFKETPLMSRWASDAMKPELAPRPPLAFHISIIYF